MTELEQLLLSLLDRIEVEDDSSLAVLRFDIVERFGYTYSFGFPVSDQLQ